MHRWAVDRTALAKATELLGIQEPVKVCRVRSNWWAGQYDYRPLHLLRVHTDWDKHDIHPDFTIWHEIVHALQCERDFGGDGAAFYARINVDYDEVLDERGRPRKPVNQAWFDKYDSISWEQEADEIALRYWQVKSLVKRL